MNFESAHNKTRETTGIHQPVLIRSFQVDASNRVCVACGSPVLVGATRCNACGIQLKTGENSTISLKDTLLFFSVLLLIALNIAPVWSSDLIFGKAIFFLQRLGVYLPESLGEAVKYRSMVANVIDIYHTLNLVYYLTIALIAFLFFFDRIRVSRGYSGFSRNIWLFLGLALLIFPLTNLIISWNMFVTPGVIGTAIASFIVLFAGMLEP